MLSAEGKLRGRWIGRSVGGLGGGEDACSATLSRHCLTIMAVLAFFYTTCVSWFAFLLLAFDTREAGVLGLPFPPHPPPPSFVLGLSCGWVVLRYAEEGDRFFFFGGGGEGDGREFSGGVACSVLFMCITHSMRHGNMFGPWSATTEGMSWGGGGGVAIRMRDGDVCF